MIPPAKDVGGGSQLPQKCEANQKTSIFVSAERRTKVGKPTLCIPVEAKRSFPKPSGNHGYQENCICCRPQSSKALGTRSVSPQFRQPEATSKLRGSCCDRQERCASDSLLPDSKGTSESVGCHPSNDKKRLTFAVKFCRFLIRLYQVTAGPYLGGQCRFHPTCSQYALDALSRYGFLRGLGKILLRVAKCHPFHPGGYDPA